jgi:predicted TIM-barrel fold metal-dependent hydrolase
MKLKHQVISGDSHLEVDTSRWMHRVPEKYRENAPHTVRLPNGGDAWVVDGSPPVEAPFDLYGGKGRDKWTPFGQNYDELAGSGPPEQRLKEQEQGKLDAEVLYPNEASGPKLWRRMKDDVAYNAVVRGYNDWLAEEYCSFAPDRLIGLGVLPYSSLDVIMEELEHCARLGFKGVLLNGFPNGHGYPLPEDDRFWAAVLDMDMPVAVHVDLDRTGERAGPLFKYPVEDKNALRYTDLVAQVARFGRAAGGNAIQFIVSGLFDRFPNLRIMLAENQCGWVPFYMSQADVRYQRHIIWSERLLGYKPLKELPSYYLRNNCWWGFQIDPIGVELRYHLGVDHMVWASDFPHQESEWPNDDDVLTRNFVNVPEDEKQKMVCTNAIEFFHLDID